MLTALRKHSVKVQMALWLAVALILVNMWAPGAGIPAIRFELSPAVKYAAFLLIDGIPVLLFMNALLLSSKTAKEANIVLAFILALPAALDARMIIKRELPRYFEHKTDVFFQRLHEIRTPQSVIAVYRISNGGGSGARFIVRQERPLGIGLKVVRDLANVDGEFEVNVNVLNSKMLEMHNDYYQSKTRIDVKPSVIFGELSGG